MAVAANFSSPDREKFKHCYGRLISFTYRDEDSVRTDLNILLDELNSIEYSIAIVCEEVCVFIDSPQGDSYLELFIHIGLVSLIGHMVIYLIDLRQQLV